MSRVVLPSPAKLNLFLKVQNKCPDGFHNIVTVFERIGLSDEISFRVTAGGSVRIICDHPHVPIGHKNLVYKVARFFQKELGVHQGAEIKIKKRIPVAAGLAGGSSNAATAIFGLNQIWKIGLSKEKMLSCARKIGSDVAFFLYDTSWGLGTGRGDHIERINISTKLWHILVVPRVRIYSWKVYGGLSCDTFPRFSNQTICPGCDEKALEKEKKKNALNHKLQLTKKGDNANILIRNLKEDNILGVGRLLVNDLETEVIRLCPQLNKLKERLKSLNTKGVMISGSGPSVFGLTSTEKDAEFIKSVLSRRFSQVFVVRTL